MSKNSTAAGQRLALALAALAAVLAAAGSAMAAQPRALGLDISAWQGNISQTTWNNIHNLENRDFVFIRSSRGGTTGVDHRQGSYPTNNNDIFTLSQRYDDPYFVQNINLATTAGLFAGSYHFSRPDVVVDTENSNGVPNNGIDEADHFMQMAGAWMRPGYLLPVHDLEAGQSQRSPAELSTFAVDFSNRIYEVMGFRPIVYSSQSYANYVDSSVPEVYPHLWIARWPQGGGQQFTGDLQNDNPPPSPSTANVYGEWNPNHTPSNPYPDGHPWKFWQYSSGERLQSYNNGNSNLDGDVANGGMEFLKDHLVPALWWTDASGDWSTLTNWNSGQPPTPPLGPPTVPSCGSCPLGTTGQRAPIGTQTLPTSRLPGAAGAGVTSGQHDTVIIDRGAANPTITLSTGTHNVRKLFVREEFNITGGSLTVNYDNPKNAVSNPSLYDPKAGPISALFSAPVSLSGSGDFSAYRLQVDSGNAFTLGGGALTFSQIDLMPHATTPASIAMTGNLNFTPYENGTAVIANGAGAGSSGFLDLSGGARTFNVANGSSSIDMSVNVPITNGGLTKTGLGTLALNGANSYNGNTIIQAGQLHVASPFLADSSNIYVSAGSTLQLGFGGNDVVRSLTLNGIPQPEGIWGPEGSGAQFTSSLLSGTGFLHVTATPPPPPPPGPGNVLDHFEIDEGHFNSVYNYSPVSQTFGLTDGTTIDRVVGEHEGLGAASQELNLVSDGSANWQLRHNSGIGSIANPSGNVPLQATGYVGFWLKTDDAGITVRIGIDDPVDNTALERGTEQAVIADNEWHLYQWNFEDDSDWLAFAGGANGVIDNAVVTIDSIWFAGAGDAQIYLDTVSHNPNGLLAAYIPGDYDRNGLIEAADRAIWQAAFGSTVIPGTGADGNGDGFVDVADYLLWRKRMSQPAGSATTGTSNAAPEPSSLVLMMAVAAGMLLGRHHRTTRAA